MPTITNLHIYPIKSCAGVTLQQAMLTAAGIEGDRAFMLVTPDGRMLSQRSHPTMALIRPRPADRGLRVAVHDRDDLEIEVDPSGPDIEVKLFRDNLTLVDQGNVAADWFSSVLGGPCRLVWSGTDLMRTGAVGDGPVGTGNLGQLSTRQFYDAGPLLLCNQASLDRFNRQRGGNAVSIDRFRPNIVVTGAPAGDELTWPGLRGREVALRNRLPCERCELPNVDQETGRVDQDVYQDLRSHVARLDDRYSAGYPFGAYMGALQTGGISVGEELTVA